MVAYICKIRKGMISKIRMYSQTVYAPDFSCIREYLAEILTSIKIKF